jgi:ABC-2 type transport system permease protein
MVKFIDVFQFLFKQSMSPKYLVDKLKNNKKQRNMAIFISIILLMSVPSYAMFIKLFIDLFDVINHIQLGDGLLIQQGSLFIVFAVLFSFLIIIIFGMYQIIAHFYFSNETKILITLPIETNHILISKFLIIYIYEIIISLFTVFPFFLIYGIKTDINLLQWIYLLLVFLILPIIPLVLIGSLTVLIMKFSNLFRKRDLIRMIGMFAILVLALAFQAGISQFMMTLSSDPATQQEQLKDLIQNNHFLTERAGKIYPVILLSLRAIESVAIEATFNLMVLYLISGLALYLFVILLKSVYLKSYLIEQEQTTNKKKESKTSKNTSVPFAIMSIDFKTLLRVPIYLFNCLSSIIIIPLLLIIMPIMTAGSGMGELKGIYNQMAELFWLITALVIAVFATLNPIAATTFSREGKTNWIMRTLPISARDHIKGRFLTAFYTQIAFSVITIGLVLYIVQQDFLYAFVSFVLSLLASIPLIYVGIYIDLKRPVLVWDNPQQAVKQNMNVLISMAIGIIYSALSVGIYFGIQFLKDPLPLFNNFGSYVIIYGLLNIILFNVIYKYLEQNFERNLINMG